MSTSKAVLKFKGVDVLAGEQLIYTRRQYTCVIDQLLSHPAAAHAYTINLCDVANQH